MAPPDDPVGRLFDLERFGIKLGLDNIRTLARALDHPERSFSCIVVAGTNGKGSVAAAIERGLRAAGYRTGLYTSPHLIELAERFAVDGEPVDDGALATEALTVVDTADALQASGRLPHPPTFFEATTALALSLFRRRSVQAAVLEVGLGGRFDATNIVTPAAVAIPSIDIDHQQHLGETIEAIATEKAGVIKPGSLVVTGETKPEARRVVEGAAAQRGARLIDIDDGVTVRWTIDDAGLTRVTRLATPLRDYGPLTLALRGRHQVRNGLVAVRLLEELGAAGLQVSRDAILSALTGVRCRGRLELVDAAPGRRVLLDPAHNVAAATALADYVRTLAPAGLPAVFGALADKDVIGMLRALGPVATRVICAPIDSPRARSVDDLQAAVRTACPGLPVSSANTPDAALDQAWRHGSLALATGSMYLVGALLQRLTPRGEVPRA